MSSRASLESDHGLAAPPSRRLSGTASGGLRARGNSAGTLAQEVNLISLDDDPAPAANPMALQPYGAPVMQQQQQPGMGSPATRIFLDLARLFCCSCLGDVGKNLGNGV
jgi:hypothetical protein